MIDRETLCDLEAEQAACGIALCDPSAADQMLAVLRPESFYRDAHRRLWGAVLRLRQKRSGCDVLTVADDLQAAGAENAVDPAYLSQLAGAAPSPTMAAEYAALVREAHSRREIVRAAKVAIAGAQDPARTLEDVRDSVAAALRDAAEAAAAVEGPVSLADAVLEAYQHIESVYEGRERPGIGTGIGVVDRWTGGLHKGELTLLGGRPSVGKSSLAQEMASHIASRGGRVYMASAEMPRRTVAMRGLSAEGAVDGRRLRGTPPLDGDDWGRLSRALGVLQGFGGRFFVDDRSRNTGDIAAQARRLHAQQHLSLIVVDHLQHLQSPKALDNRAQAIGRMAAECKDLAVSLDVPVLALSQLNRQAPGGNRRPELHDLRDSGELEQIADVVLLLHRASEDPPPPLCRVDCAVAKERNGELGAFALWHHRPTGRWYDNAQQIREGRDSA